MKIEVNLEKKYFFGIMLIGLLAVGIAGVIAYNSEINDPSVLGHSVDEMDWGSAINSNVTADGFCIGNDTYKDCIQSWGGIGGAGVSKIIAGSGISLSSQTGEVTITSTGGGDGGNLEVMKKQSPSQGMNEEVCCDAGWVRTGCGEGSDQSAYSYPAGDNCCHGGGFVGDGLVYVICARGGGGSGGGAARPAAKWYDWSGNGNKGATALHDYCFLTQVYAHDDNSDSRTQGCKIIPSNSANFTQPQAWTMYVSGVGNPSYCSAICLNW